ncbi:hypothetical protein CR513_10218, partial [Mucuna pruriens]
MVYQPWCIQYPQLEPYELKSGLIHLLPKFHGLVGEDPHDHLKEFHVVCSIMRSQGILEDYIKIKAFPFSLDGVAKDWLYLQSVLFNTWGDMKRMFLEKFFLAFRTATIKKEICGIRQHSKETLSINGQDASSSKAPNLQYGEQCTTVWDQRSRPIPNVARVYGICTSVEHPTNMCPTLQEIESDHPESVGAIGGY